MGFNVLKDPQDPRNFIITPAPAGGADPALLAAGQAGGTPTGTLARPALRQFGAAGGLDPEFEAQRFGGPGDPRQFRRGLINLHGRLLKKTFERDTAAMWEDFARAGGIRTPEVNAQVDTALKSRGGFAAARDALADFRDQQPDKVAQRAVDLKAIQDKEQRDSTEQLARTTEIQNRNEIFKYDLGLPPAKVADDREKFNRRMTLAGRVADAQVLSDHFGSVRFGESTSSEKAAVKQAYADIKREITIGIGAFSEAGALSDQERDFFGEFAGEFTTLSPIQDSSRRVALNDAMNFLSSGADDIKQANRALSRGARPSVWQVQPRSVDQILAREVPEGLTELTQAEIAVEATRAENLAAGELGPTFDRPAPAETIVAPEGGRRELSGEAGADFFEGIGQFITKPVTEEDTVERLRRERGR